MRSFLLGIILSLLFCDVSSAQSRFGRYVGVLQNDQLQQEQLAKLDFIVAKQDANSLSLMAVLSLYFGGFDSSEYVSYHFDNVRFNLVTGSIVFDQPDQDTTFMVQQFSDGKLEGNLRSATAGNIGRLILQNKGEVRPSKALVQPMWGEYRGFCKDYLTILQIQTSRSTEDTTRVGNPFGTYEITAQRAESNVNGCFGDTTACVKYVYNSGSYDFFRGRLSLYGMAENQTCQVGSAGIRCNDCDFRRVSKESASGDSFAVKINPASWSDVPSPGRDGSTTNDAPTSLGGVFYGYLFHERLGVYQAAEFNLATYQQNDSESSTQQLRMSAVAKLYFGDHDSVESLSYRFNERPYSLLAPQIVFERVNGDNDAILQVTKLTSQEVEGIWYSIHFGRVGTFVLKKGSIPLLPEGAKRMERIAGLYQNPTWKITLDVARESTPISTKNPFFPLNFKGYAYLVGVGPNSPIVGGSYDFYTGKMSFSLNNGSIFSGVRPARSQLLLKRPTAGITRALTPHAMQRYSLDEQP